MTVVVVVEVVVVPAPPSTVVDALTSTTDGVAGLLCPTWPVAGCIGSDVVGTGVFMLFTYHQMARIIRIMTTIHVTIFALLDIYL